MSADNDDRLRRKPTHPAAHLTDLSEVGNDAGDANDVVLMRRSSLLKRIQGREVEQGAGRGDVLLDHHQSPRAMKHAQGEAALLAGDLVVIQLHRIDGAATEFVVLRVGTETELNSTRALAPLG